jgi:hypothetical protein
MMRSRTVQLLTPFHLIRQFKESGMDLALELAA